MDKKDLEELNLFFKRSYLKEKTVARYRYMIDIYINYVATVRVKVNIFDVETARDFLIYLKYEKKLSIGTVNDYRSAIKLMFEVLDKGWNDRKIPYEPGYKTLPIILEKKTVFEIINRVDNIIYNTVLTTIYSSGLRISEALNLRVSDIMPDRMQIYVRESKNGSARYAILSEKNLDIMREYLKKHPTKNIGKWQSEDYLFCNLSRNIPISSKSISKALKDAVESYNIKQKITPHVLRHCFAVHALEEGMDIFKIKKLLGHNSIISTCYYLKVVDARKLGCTSPFDT